MNKNVTQFINRVGLLVALLFGFAISGFVVTACKTNPIQATIKAEGALITSVDVGMSMWHDYVVIHLTDGDGKVTQKQIDTVKQYYNTYVSAQNIAKAAIEKALASGSTNSVDVDIANSAVTSAEQSLLSILNHYVK